MSRLQSLLDFHEEDPKDSFVLFALASEYRKLGELEQALTFFRRLEESDPIYVGLYYHLGKLLEQLNRKQDAMGVYKKGIEIAQLVQDFHARSELQSALIEVKLPD